MDTQEREEVFPQVLRDWLRRFYVPDFDWLIFTAPSLRNRLMRPAAKAVVAIVTTAGARTRTQPPFDVESKEGDAGFRVIPSDTPGSALRFNHPGYDVRRAYKDPDVVFPLQLLQHYVREGRVGALAPNAYSLMGYITRYDELLQETAPSIVDMLQRDGVDLALLVPA
jgi:D-proline reductase (dithiol) PrdB